MIGRGRATQYLARREVFDLGKALPIYEIGEDGSSRKLAVLNPVLPHAFFVGALSDDVDSRFFEDLPYFLHDLRPAGFLGRLVPRRHPELKLPRDIRHWTADQTLSFLSRHGWNLPGNFIIGEEAFGKHLEHASSPRDEVLEAERMTRYPDLADNVLEWGDPGSSAGGEQPKFLVTRMPAAKAAIVKFSPPVRDESSQRIADLLVAEHLALETIRRAGHAAARTSIVRAGDRVFLEAERFDRFPGGGRRGLISMEALDAEFVGHGGTWADSAAALNDQGRIDSADLAEVQWRGCFGRLIANADMHGGNLSFFTRGARILGVAPAYDMAPALYAPGGGLVRESPFNSPTPDASEGPFWTSACQAACEFWTAVAAHEAISPRFRALADSNGKVVSSVEPLGRLLPRV